MSQSVTPPVTSVTAIAGSVVTSGGTAVAILNGASPGVDYISGSSSSFNQFVLGFSWPAALSSPYTTILGFQLSYETEAGSPYDRVEIILPSADGLSAGETSFAFVGSGSFLEFVTSFQGSVGTSALSPEAWDEIEIFLLTYSTAGKISTFSITVMYDEAPTPTFTSPSSGAHLGTAGVAFAWSYSDPQNEPQDGRQLTIAGPDGTVYYSESYTQTSQNSVTVNTPLPTGIVLTATLQVANVGVPGALGPPATVSFTITDQPPATPALSATWDPTNGRVILALQGRDNLLGVNGASGGGAGYSPALGSAGSLDGIQSLNNCSLATAAIATADLPAAVAAGLGTNWVQTATALGNMGFTTNGPPVVPGQTVTAIALAKAASSGGTARTVNMTIQFYNFGGFLVGSSSTVTGTEPTPGNHQWVQLVQQATVPATAVQARVACAVVNPAASEVHNWTAIGLFPVASSALTVKSSAGVSSGPVWSRGGVAYTDAGWNSGVYADASQITVERSNDGGQSWQPVRAADPLVWNTPVQQATVFDYEAAPLSRVLYRAKSTTPSLSGASLSSPWTTFLDNPGFEEYPTASGNAIVAPWVESLNSNFSVTLDSAEAHPGPGVYAASVPLIPTSTENFYAAFAVQEGLTTIRWSGWWRAANAAGLTFVLYFVTANGGTTISTVTVLASTTVPATGNGWQYFDSGDIAIPSTCAWVQLNTAATGTADGISNGTFWLDDMALAFGPAYVTTDSVQGWLKDPLVPSSNVPVSYEPKTSPGSTGSTVYGTVSEAERNAQVVIYGEQNPDPVVVSPTRSGEQFKQQAIYVDGDAQAAKIRAMLRSGHTLLMQLCTGDSFGEQHYVTVLGTDQTVRIDSQDHAAGQRYRFVVDLAETAAP